MGLLVNVARQHFLASTGLTGDQHRGITAGHSCRQLQKLGTGRLDRNRAFDVSCTDAAKRMSRHQIEQGFGLERLDQIIRSTLTHRIDGTLNGAVGSHQQHRQLRLTHSQQREQLMTIHTGHVDVADHQTERFARHRRQRFFSAADRVKIMAGQQQRISQRFAQRTIILDQQHLDAHVFYSAPWTAQNSGRITCAHVPRPTRERSCNSP